MKQSAKQRRIRQRNLKAVTCKNLVWHVIIIIIMMIAALCSMPRPAVSEEVNESYKVETIKPHVSDLVVYESYEPDTQEEETEIEVNYYPEFTYSKDWSVEDSYLLAKIAMAEAEGCNTRTKTLIIMCVLNRVWSDEFPDTIHDVIFQTNQFSPIDNGRWDRVEPNEDCWEAVKVVMEAKYDYSGGATYFESCDDEDNWHSRNLEFLYESDGIRFYK